MTAPKFQPEDFSKTAPKAQPAPELRVVQPESPKTPAPAPAAAPKGAVNLGGLTGKAKTSKKKTVVHPVAETSEELEQAVLLFSQQKPMFDQLEGSLEQLRGQILADVIPQIFGCSVAEYSMIVNGPLPTPEEAKAGVIQPKVMVSLQNRYSGADFSTGMDEITKAIGPERAAEYFTQGIRLAIDFSVIPEERKQALINDLLPVFQKHKVMGGEEPDSCEAVTTKEIVVPKPGFHEIRRAKFTKEENLAIHAVLPAIAIIKTKGIKS